MAWKPGCAVILSPAETLYGQLQRGLGKAYLAALYARKDNLQDMMVRCLTEDPRFDRQVDCREDYYADIILKRKLDLQPLTGYLRHAFRWRADVRNHVLFATLTSLVARGHQPALDMLRHYIVQGRHWREALRSMLRSDHATPDWFNGLEDIFARRTPGRQRLRETLEEAPVEKPIFALFRAQSAAVDEECRRLEHLRRPTLRTDRPRHQAAEIMSIGAAPEDYPLLVKLLTEGVSEGQHICSRLEALGRCASSQIPDILLRALDEMRCSHGRSKVLEVMAKFDITTLSETTALDCLWDAESDVRAIAAGVVAPSSRAVRRLEAIVANPFETPDCRDAAQSRLDTLCRTEVHA